MGKTIEKTVFYPHAIGRVWTALTDRHALAEWLMPNDFEPEVGRGFRFQVDPMPGYSGIAECKVLELEEPHRLVYDWVVVPKNPHKPRPPAMVLTWTLQERDGGTELKLHQTGADVLNWWWRFSMNIGWSRMLKKLLPKVLRNCTDSGFTPGAITRRDYKVKTVPEHFAK